MLPQIQKLFAVSEGAKGETLAPLFSGARFTLEHIVSRGEASPPGFWYDQEQAEWVALIAGQATLTFAEGELQLEAGDALLIPAHLKHRVAATSLDAIWLALHFESTVD